MLVTFLAYRDHGFIRFMSERNDETIFEIKIHDRSRSCCL
jgi:hypothetical protein